MKKLLLLLAPVMLLSLVGCGPDKTTSPAPSTTVPPVISSPVEEKINTHDEYIKAAADTKLTVLGKVVGKKDGGEGKSSTYYLQNGSEGYTLYTAETLEVGQVYNVTGTKAIFGATHQLSKTTSTKVTKALETPIVNVTSLASDVVASLNSQGCLVTIDTAIISDVNVREGNPLKTFSVTDNSVSYQISFDTRYMSADDAAATQLVVDALVVGDKIKVAKALQDSYTPKGSASMNSFIITGADSLVKLTLTEEELLNQIGANLFANLTKRVDADNVTLTLPSAEGAVITWASSDPATISVDGVVTRSVDQKVVTLTAHVVVGSLSKDFTHEITVTSNAPVAEGILYDFNTILSLAEGGLDPAASYKPLETPTNFKLGANDFAGINFGFGLPATISAPWAAPLFGDVKLIKLAKKSGAALGGSLTLMTPVATVTGIKLDYAMWDYSTTLTIQTSTDNGVTWGNDVTVANDAVTRQTKETAVLTFPAAVNNALVRISVNDACRAVLASISII